MNKKQKKNISCNDATFLILKKLERKLSFNEKLTLTIHLLKCKKCRHLFLQTAKNADSIKKMNKKMRKNSVKLKLSVEQQIKIEKALKMKGK